MDHSVKWCSHLPSAELKVNYAQMIVQLSVLESIWHGTASSQFIYAIISGISRDCNAKFVNNLMMIG